MTSTKKQKAPLIFVKRTKPVVSEVFDTYWKFAVRRQEAFFSRIEGQEKPWSDDPIISEFKFTNAYRASDRVSQYLIKNVIYSKKWGLKDTVFRILLFKIFNKIETWQLLEEHFGEISTKTFNLNQFDAVLEKQIAAKKSIYSAAYIMPSGPKKKYLGVRKHKFHLTLLSELLKDDFHQLLKDQSSLEAGFELLLSIESFGRFLAYQFIIDLNYSDWFNYSENDFVVPGPGALDGIRKCFTDLGDYTPVDIIKMMTEDQNHHFDRLNYNFKNLWGRPLHLIDCQNLFCEVDKYSRIAHPDVQGISGRTRIKQKFNPTPSHLNVWYPPKWRINKNIVTAQEYQSM
ncbi:MAG: putative DNA base hypermodification protein [Kangiellaceae bacterium]|nr:putative DNA base hypermodification protein [Kangiellaceae bacterium]MCW8997156.1 putative DNA base hypermodification protein [Kangiellaceae bacterium]MCW9016306.1 putative DNA base hypermodification protein [Kangiellaceae bacterium]